MGLNPGDNVSAAALLGVVSATASTLLVSTPVTVWGWTVFNNAGSTQSAGVGVTTNTVLTNPYVSGTTSVPSYGYEVASLAAKVDHTNMSLFVFYTPYQQ